MIETLFLVISDCLTNSELFLLDKKGVFLYSFSLSDIPSQEHYLLGEPDPALDLFIFGGLLSLGEFAFVLGDLLFGLFLIDLGMLDFYGMLLLKSFDNQGLTFKGMVVWWGLGLYILSAFTVPGVFAPSSILIWDLINAIFSVSTLFVWEFYLFISFSIVLSS